MSELPSIKHCSLAGKSELEMYSGEENRGQSVHDHFHGKYIALLDELDSPAFCLCFIRMFV